MRSLSALAGPFRAKRGIVHAAIIGALITLLAASGAGITFALWNSQANVTGSATAAKLSITTENFGSGNFTFRNNALTVRSSVTITNTTDTPSATKADLGIALDTITDTEGIGTDIRVRTWRLAAGASCTDAPSTTVREGTWGSFTAFTEPGLLAAGTSVTYCIISSAVGDERSTLSVADGSAVIQPRIIATLAVHNFTVSATATAQQQTSHIYPTTNQPANYTWYQIRSIAAQRGCVDVNGGLGGAGTNLIDFACKTGTGSDTQNQDWELRSSSTTPAYVTIVTRYNAALRINATASDSRVEVQTAQGTGSPEWQFQHRSSSGGDSVFQIVNRANGLCLQSSTASGALVLAECDGSAQQGYTLQQRGLITPNIPSLTCTDSPGNTAQTVTLGWTEPAIGAYTVEAQKSGTQWSTLGTTAPGATSFTLPTADATWTNGSRAVRVTFNGATAANTNIWKGVTGSETRLRCATPTANVTGLACTSTPTGVAYAWNELALGTYTFQARTTATGTTWTTIGTVTTGATSLTISGTPSTGITAGTRELRVMNGTIQIASGLSVWKGQLAVNGPQVLQCTAPTPTLANLTCTNSGTAQVTIAWSHPAHNAYTVSLLPSGVATGTDIGSVEPGAQSITFGPASTWGAGIRTISVSDGLQTATIDVQKFDPTFFQWSHRLRCLTSGMVAPDAVTPPTTAPTPSPTPTPTPAATKTATLSGTDGYYLGLLWPAQAIAATTNYTVLLAGTPFPVVPVNEHSMDRMHLTSANFAGVAIGDTVLEIYDGSTLVISQPLRITTNVNDPANRAVFAR